MVNMFSVVWAQWIRRKIFSHCFCVCMHMHCVMLFVCCMWRHYVICLCCMHGRFGPVSCENGDPQIGDPGPYFHNILVTPGSPFSQEIGDPLMKMGTPSARHVHWLECSVWLWLIICYSTISFYPCKLLGYGYIVYVHMNINYPWSIPSF